MTVIFQFSSRLAFRKPDITITHPAINPKTMMRLRPFLSGPMKLSKDPVPSAKAAFAQQQSSRATTNAFRHFGRSHDWREEIRLFITQYLYVISIDQQDKITFIYYVLFNERN